MQLHYGQKCNCLNELRYLEDKAERNLPSYKDQVINKKRNLVYEKHKQECNVIAAKLPNDNDCIYLMAKYISFFRDEHLSVNYKKGYFPYSSLDDTNTIHSFFKNEKIYPVPKIEKQQSKGIIGLWVSQDKSYIVQIVSHKTPLSNYAGLIIKGDKNYWTKGQLKFLLKQTGKGKYDCIYLRPQRQPRLYHAVSQGLELTIGRINVFYRMKDTTDEQVPDKKFELTNKFEFSQLSDKTNYIRIPDFSFNVYPIIDSIIKVNLASITSKPNLIIDVRNYDVPHP